MWMRGGRGDKDASRDGGVAEKGRPAGVWYQPLLASLAVNVDRQPDSPPTPPQPRRWTSSFMLR